MTTLFAIATFNGFNANPDAYKARLVKRQKDRARNAVKRTTAKHSTWLAEIDRLARVKVEARKLEREAQLKVLSNGLRPIPNCMLRSKREQNDMDAMEYSWRVFGKPYAGGR